MNISINKYLENDNEHKMLFRLFFDHFKFNVDFQNLNYERLLFLVVVKHRIVNHFYKIADFKQYPESFKRRMDQLRIEQKKRNLAQFALITELKEILTPYDHIFLKGLLLSQQLYNDHSFRDSSDIDVLIHKEDEKKVTSLLISNGFIFKNNMDHHWVCEKNHISVEIHRKLSSFANVQNLEKRIWSNQRKININGKEFNSVNIEVYMSYLSLVGTQHCWSRLSWVLDYIKLPKQSDAMLVNDAWDDLFENVFFKGVLLDFRHKFIIKSLLGLNREQFLTRFQRAHYFALTSNYSMLKSYNKSLSRFLMG